MSAPTLNSKTEFQPSERFRRIANRARTLAVFYTFVLFLATHLPLAAPEGVSNIDKWYHLGAYLTLTMTVLLCWELTAGLLKARHYFSVWLAGTFYAAFDEYTQIPVGRTCDMLDWVADVVGILCGIVAFQTWRGWIYALVDAGELPSAREQ
ncbi:MAG: VanZ family protein [Planctomycetota bacterium]